MSDEATGFSAQWEEAYRGGGHRSVWPWSDLVSLVMRNIPRDRKGLRVLEIGMGAGANVSFFNSLGAIYHGIEGSAAAVADLRRRFPDMAEQFVVGDFTRSLPQSGDFDVVIDRSSLTHNSAADIARALEMMRNCLRPDGVYIGVDWFSTSHFSFKLGQQGADPHTRQNIERGHLTGTGRVHFVDETHLRTLFSAFTIRMIRHKVHENIVPADQDRLAWYDIVCANSTPPR